MEEASPIMDTVRRGWGEEREVVSSMIDPFWKGGGGKKLP